MRKAKDGNGKKAPKNSSKSEPSSPKGETREEAFTSHDKILLWFRRVGPPTFNELISYHKFGALYSAKKFLERVIGEYPTEQLSPTTLRVRDWFNVISDPKSSHTVKDIMEHKYTKSELKWQLPTPYPEYADRVHIFHHGSHPSVATRGTAEEGKAAKMSLVEHKVNEREKRRAERELGEEPAQRKKTSSPRKTEPGIITIAALAQRINMDPREARGILRTHSKKPDGGWQWKEEDTAAVQKLLEKHRKSGK